MIQNRACQKATQMQSVVLKKKKKKSNGKDSGTQDTVYNVIAKVDDFATWKYPDCFNENGYSVSL